MNAERFCDQCAVPYGGWMKEQCGGHWDTCPNRVFSPPADDVNRLLGELAQYASDSIGLRYGTLSGRLVAEYVDKITSARRHTPADDVREALVEPVAWAIFGSVTGTIREFSTDRDRVSDAVALGADVRPLFEVRLRGTVTDAEPTDAQILAGLNAELPPWKAAPALNYYAAENIARMRNVLRAAAAAGEARS